MGERFSLNDDTKETPSPAEKDLMKFGPSFGVGFVMGAECVFRGVRYWGSVEDSLAAARRLHAGMFTEESWSKSIELFKDWLEKVTDFMPF